MSSLIARSFRRSCGSPKQLRAVRRTKLRVLSVARIRAGPFNSSRSFVANQLFRNDHPDVSVSRVAPESPHRPEEALSERRWTSREVGCARVRPLYPGSNRSDAVFARDRPGAGADEEEASFTELDRTVSDEARSASTCWKGSSQSLPRPRSRRSCARVQACQPRQHGLRDRLIFDSKRFRRSSASHENRAVGFCH